MNVRAMRHGTSRKRRQKSKIGKTEVRGERFIQREGLKEG